MEMRVVVPDGASTGSLANRLTAAFGGERVFSGFGPIRVSSTSELRRRLARPEANSLLPLSVTTRTKE